MYKNQLQELAQRSCFNLPSYTCIREGPDHAPRFKATVNFNGETFESPSFCTTLRQAEHSAAEVALNSLSSRGPSHFLAAKILDETGVYKNLLQEVAQRVGAALPAYTTFRSGLGHLPVFTCEVELAGITFTGEPAKNKKQAEKNAAMAAWSSLKQLAQEEASSSPDMETPDEQEHITVARALLKYLLKEKMAAANTTNPLPFPKRFPKPDKKPPTTKRLAPTGSKILPLIRSQTTPRNRHTTVATATITVVSNGKSPSSSPVFLDSHGSSLENKTTTAATTVTTVGVTNCRTSSSTSILDNHGLSLGNKLTDAMAMVTSGVANGRSSSSPSLPDNHGSVLQKLDNQGSSLQKFPAAGAAPYIPVRRYMAPYHGMAPPVTVRTAVPVYSAPPLPPPPNRSAHITAPPVHIAPPVHVRPMVPVFAAPSPVVPKDGPPFFMGPLSRIERPPVITRPSPLKNPLVQIEENPLFQIGGPQVIPLLPPLSKPSVQVEENNPLIQLEGPSIVPCPPPMNKPSVQMEENGSLSLIEGSPIVPCAPVLSKPSIKVEENNSSIWIEGSPIIPCAPLPSKPLVQVEETGSATTDDLLESTAVQQSMLRLKI